MKRFQLLLVLYSTFLSVLFFLSCVVSTDNELYSYQPLPSKERLQITPDESGVIFDCTTENAITYQWYKSPDGIFENSEPLTNATAPLYATGYISKGVHYFYCVVQTESTDITVPFTVAYTGLPLVQIETADGAFPTTAKESHEGRLRIFYPNKTEYDSQGDISSENKFTIKIRGNATAYYPKHPYKLKLPKKRNLLDISSRKNNDKDWVLLAGYCDKTLLRTKIGFFTASLFNTLKGNEQLYIPHSEFVDLVLNGEYLGNYCLTDAVKEGESRLAVNQNETDVGGIGFVAELDGYYRNEAKWFISDKNEGYSFKFPDTDDTNFDSYMAYLKNNINAFESALYNENVKDDWKNYIDIESFARWFLIHNIIANLDTNYFFSKKTSDSSSKIVMGPVWDFEWSVGIGWYYGSRPRNPAYWCVNGWYFSELLKKEAFVSEVKKQWQQLLLEYPHVADTINNKMDAYAERIAVSQKINFIKWDILNAQISVGGIPLGSYEAELACDKQFMESRISWLNNAINEL